MASSTVIREVSKDVWIFSRPFSRFGIFPVGGRSTAIKLRSGDVWVLASTPLDTETKAKLDELGPVKYIIGPDAVHSLYLPEFKQAYPSAQLIGVEPHITSPGSHLTSTSTSTSFSGAYGKDTPSTKYGFEDEIDACYFSGFINKDVAFLHRDSKSLVVADLLFNLPGREQYSKSGGVGVVGSLLNKTGMGKLDPWGWAHKRFVWSAGRDKEAMKRDAETVDGWDFTRIIPCHGDVIEENAKGAWREAYKWYLQSGDGSGSGA